MAFSLHISRHKLNFGDMKRIITCILTLFLLVSAAVAVNAQNYPFKGGEQLDFKLQVKAGVSIDIGSGSFRLEEEGSNYHLDMKLKSNSFVSSLYRLDHVYQSHFTRSGLVPVRFHREAKEGSDYWVKSDYTFSNGGKKVHGKVQKSSRPAVEADATFSNEVRDLASVFYVVRTLDFSKLAKTPARYTVLMDRNIIDFEIRVIGKEVKKISGLGKFNTVKIALKGKSRGNFDTNASKPFSNMSDAEDMIYFWLSDDECRAPLFFTAPVSFGALSGRCVSYKGLKYKLSSKIN